MITALSPDAGDCHTVRPPFALASGRRHDTGQRSRIPSFSQIMFAVPIRDAGNYTIDQVNLRIGQSILVTLQQSWSSSSLSESSFSWTALPIRSMLGHN